MIFSLLFIDMCHYVGYIKNLTYVGRPHNQPKHLF
jgi:hypothetical protein